MKWLVLASLATTLAQAQIQRVAPHADLAKRQAASPSSTSHAAATRTATGAATATRSPAHTGGGGAVPSSPLASLTKIGTATTAEATQPLPTTFAAGATPPVKGAPPLPAINQLNPAHYPPLDRIPPLDSPEVKQWLSEIDLSNIPSVNPTAIGGCANATNAQAIKDGGADGNCWWTCGGCSRASDITYCPNKNDWGASFDDGPSPYTPRLLNLLESQNLKSTFFIVGSRALSRPEMVQAEYMLGHQLSIHTWSHSSLTTLSNEEIVAELGWTKKVIHDITGVSPNTMRPPFGDIDDRVRYIALQMGLRPVIWTQYQDQVFDTRDWQIGGGVVNATGVYNTFNNFLTHAVQNLPNGFIVLAHDLYQQSVDLAVDYILPGVINAGQLKIKTIGACLGESPEQLYIETASNSSSADSDPLLQTTSTFVGATGTGFVPGIALEAQQTSSPASGSSKGKNLEASKSGSSANAQQTGNTSGAMAVKAGGAGGLFAATMLALAYLL
ncbi:putative Chitin deacetylase [Rhodotorula toruloides ATCC 204091]|uniref:chitin deacetylase n=1 Tax=Rhodotorula toruloides TaxID=5286 RepID=A0A0K3CEJ8_RHOTO|nr:putative Chitin deacetylase [Rhodotorula toruloides ATCC 204091]KAK4336377.1 Chitin deacetylase [Rhodotorula toruloides]PRQ74270.1 putative chitin deacetylase [Rhodotorula toruloides]